MGAQVHDRNNVRVAGLTSLASIRISLSLPLPLIRVVYTLPLVHKRDEGISSGNYFAARTRQRDIEQTTLVRAFLSSEIYFQKDNDKRAHIRPAIVRDAAVRMPRKSYS